MMARNAADCNVQWAMMARNTWHHVQLTMVRNTLQITVCNEPWWWGTHRRSQYAMNHDGEERITDRNMQWTMMVRNTSQITMCNERWCSGTHHRSQCAMNHGQEHMANQRAMNHGQEHMANQRAMNHGQEHVANQRAMNHGYNAHLVSSTNCNAGLVSAANLKFCILSSFRGTEHVLSTLPWLQCLLSHHDHDYHAGFVSINMVTMLVLSALTWLPCWFCQH